LTLSAILLVHAIAAFTFDVLTYRRPDEAEQRMEQFIQGAADSLFLRQKYG